MTKRDAIIRLNIFTVRAARAVSAAVSNTLANMEPEPIFQFVHSDIQKYLKVLPDGEFYLSLANTTDGVNENVKFHLDLNVVKAAIRYYVCFLDGAKEAIIDRIDKDPNELLPDEDPQTLKKDLEAILRWWDGIATEDDRKLVGRRLNPFEAEQLNEILESIKQSNYTFNSNTVFDKIFSANTLISKLQNRPDDMCALVRPSSLTLASAFNNEKLWCNCIPFSSLPSADFKDFFTALSNV